MRVFQVESPLFWMEKVELTAFRCKNAYTRLVAMVAVVVYGGLASLTQTVQAQVQAKSAQWAAAQAQSASWAAAQAQSASFAEAHSEHEQSAQFAEAQSTPSRSDTLRYEVKASRYMMGTEVDATLISADVGEARKHLFKAFREMERVEGLLSMFRDSSEIAHLNREAGIRPVRVSWETFEILSRARDWAAKLDGLFDVTIGAATTLWGFSGEDDPHIPPQRELDAAQPLINIGYLQLNESDTTAFLTHDGMEVDLGGIAKGYAIDRGVAILHALGDNNFLINAGGDIYVSGEKEPGRAWHIGIRHPRKENALLATLSAHDQAVVTSGDYERMFIEDGKRYHHILDPRTLYPAVSSQSVTVIAGSAEEADVLATWLFITGGRFSDDRTTDRNGSDSPRTNGKGTDQSELTLLRIHPDFIRVAPDGSLQYDPGLIDRYDLVFE